MPKKTTNSTLRVTSTSWQSNSKITPKLPPSSNLPSRCYGLPILLFQIGCFMHWWVQTVLYLFVMLYGFPLKCWQLVQICHIMDSMFFFIDGANSSFHLIAHDMRGLKKYLYLETKSCLSTNFKSNCYQMLEFFKK